MSCTKIENLVVLLEVFRMKNWRKVEQNLLHPNFDIKNLSGDLEKWLFEIKLT